MLSYLTTTLRGTSTEHARVDGIFDLDTKKVRGTGATKSWQIHLSEHTSLLLPLDLSRHDQ